MNTLTHDFNHCIRNNWITSKMGVQYAVIEDTLYFQCSRSVKDWLFNLTFPASAYKQAEIQFYMHSGFKAMWHDVRDDIAKLEFTHIRGYSQGAVFACMAHEDRLYGREDICDTIVFGCPKFLYKPSIALQNRFDCITRLQNKDDIVTKVPPFGYKHIGQPFNLPEKKDKPKDISWVEYLSGHSPYQYRKNLGELI